MKPALSKEEYREIYALLDRVTPLKSDCGALCGAACCDMAAAESTGEEMGIYLLPGEEALHIDAAHSGTGGLISAREDDADAGGPQGDAADPWLTLTAEPASEYGFPASWDGDVYFAKCGGAAKCRRALRPIQCRTFPLVPHLTEDGELILLYNDFDFPYRCPLIEEEMPLEEDFYNAVEEAWRRLIRDPLICDMVRADSEERESSIREWAERFGEKECEV